MGTRPLPTLRKMMRGLSIGQVVVPQIRAALFDPTFKGFTIEAPNAGSRPYDGWFHPSTHPTWDERKLWYYVHQPEVLINEPFDPTSTMAVYQGHVWHLLIQEVGIQIGILRKPPMCPCGCGMPEWFVQCPETKSRGHMDGILNGLVLGLPSDEVFEFKSSVPGKASRLVSGAPDSPEVVKSFREIWPEYWAQGQEYLRMSGYLRWRGVILSMAYPFEMREVAFSADPETAYKIKSKYLRVRQSPDRLPLPCCSPRSKEAKSCPARLTCPVGRM